NSVPRLSDRRFRGRTIESNTRLSATVVAAATDLHEDTATQRAHGFMQFRLAAHHAKSADRKTRIREPSLLQCLVLNDADGFDAGGQGRNPGHFRESIHPNLLNLESYPVPPAAKNGSAYDEAGWASRIGVHDTHVIAHGARGHRCHASQLATTENRQ